MIDFPLRPNQTAAVVAIENAYRAGMKRPLVDSCVGSGKSLIMAELARRAWLRGERSIILAHTRELVRQNAKACGMLGLNVGINAAALGEHTWRAPVISASIQSVHKYPGRFGPIDNIMTDEAHLTPHSEAGMYRAFLRAFPNARQPGFSGTVFRLNGGSLVEGEGAPFDAVVYTYSILDGIRDEILAPAFSVEDVADKIDPIKLRKKQGEFDTASQDAQMLALMDRHIAQMVHHGADRRSWLVFEASTKAAKAMTERLRQWGIQVGLVLGTTAADERERTIADFIAGRLRCLVNVAALTTGFDAQCVDFLVMRRRTMSLGLYIQMVGRGLRTIGGNILASIAAGKADCSVVDFAGNIDEHGPLDFLRLKPSKVTLVSCETCGERNSRASVNCWSCAAPMTKLCPACLTEVVKGMLDCPSCGHNMRIGEPGDDPTPKPSKLLERPSGAALIAAFRPTTERAGGWIPVRQSWEKDGLVTLADANGDKWILPETVAPHAPDIRWVRGTAGMVEGLLKPNGLNRLTALQVALDGSVLPVPMPSAIEKEIAT